MVKNKARYIYSLDSMRVLAMLGVMLFHLFPTKVSGGFLGVITFFVLSGFLTMREIVLGVNENPLIAMGKKIVKLMPELVAMIFFTILVMSPLLSEYLPDVKNQAISSVFGINNIVQISDGESYFAAMASLKPFTHIWAHSMELQFYFLLLFTAGAFYREKHRMYWLGGLFFLAVLSLFLMQLLYTDAQNVTRIYYGTDTRIFSFLFGAMGAVLFAGKNGTPPIRDSFHTVFTVLLMVISGFLFFTVENGEAVYRYIFLVYTMMQLLLIYLLSAKKTASYRIFGKNMIGMMANRSYSLYLWHFPVMKLYEKLVWSKQIPIFWYIALELLLIFVITECFHQLFSRIRRRNKFLLFYVLLIPLICLYPYKPLGVVANQKYLMLLTLKNRITDVDVNIGVARTNTSSAGTDSFSLAHKEFVYEEKDGTTSSISNTGEYANTSGEGFESTITSDPAEISPASAETGVSVTGSQGLTTSSPSDSDISSAPNTSSFQETSAAPPNSTSEEDPDIAYIREVYEECVRNFPDIDIPFEEYLKIRNRKITLIGDSISVMTSPRLAEFFPNIEISAKTNRQTYHAFEFYSQLKAEGRIGDVVILALGANGDINYEVYDMVREDLGDKPLIVNTVILPWPVTESERNDAIYKYAGDRKNVYIAKWHEYCKNKPGILYDDGVHPIEIEGGIAHAYVIMEAVYRALIQN